MNKLIVICAALTLSYSAFTQTNNAFVKTSIDFLTALKANQNTDDIVAEYARFSLEDLEQGLKTDDEKYAFWLNTYNGFIQRILKEKPELYEDRRSFFKQAFIEVGGERVAFADIEHGILRRSQFEYFLGYVTNPFPGAWERKLRVKERDHRVHFALNCGAKSCPPVGIYDDTKLDTQLETSSSSFLKKYTSVEGNVINSTSLFSWFRGDFGGIKGAKEILVEREIINTADKNKEFKLSYDWTLDLDNFIEL